MLSRGRPTSFSILIKQHHTEWDMYPLPLDQHGTYPIGIEILGTGTLVLCLVLTVAWLFYLYR